MIMIRMKSMMMMMINKKLLKKIVHLVESAKYEVFNQ